MTTTTGTTASTATTTSSAKKVGLIVELSGLASFITGAVLSMSLHHYAIGILCVGAAALLVGYKLSKS